MSQELALDTNKQEINSGFLEFYELEVGSIPKQADQVTPQTGANKLYFHDGKNENSADITYDGNTYVALPIMMTGIEITGDGALNRPTITIANVESMIKTGSKFMTKMDDSSGSDQWNTEVDGVPVTSSDFKLDDLIGSRLTKRTTLEKYLASNPTIEFPKAVYIIDRIQQKSNVLVTFELAAPFDLSGTRIPGRTVVGKYCPWQYQGARSELIASDRRGACVWKEHSQINHGNNTSSSVFLNEDDEPIMKKSILGTTAWSNSTSYAVDAIVVKNNLYYQSKDSSNQGNDPELGQVFWQPIRFYETWSNNSVSYTIDTTDSRKNSIVLHNNIPWRALIAHTSSNATEPELGSRFWTRADICGKLLTSCKRRYQAQGTSSATGTNFIQSTQLATQRVLPFGGFPGSRKFR